MHGLYMPAIPKRSARPPERSNHIWHCNDAPSTASILSLSSLIAVSATFDFGLSTLVSRMFQKFQFRIRLQNSVSCM